ncbi:MAG: hypothetical protein AB7W16_07740 [Candidatus Obscuribacterales bacterium]
MVEQFEQRSVSTESNRLSNDAGLGANNLQEMRELNRLQRATSSGSDLPTVNVGGGDYGNINDKNPANSVEGRPAVSGSNAEDDIKRLLCKPDGDKPTDQDRPRNVKPAEGIIKVPPGAKPVWF